MSGMEYNVIVKGIVMKSVLVKKSLFLFFSIYLLCVKALADPGDVVASFNVTPKTLLPNPNNNTVYVGLEDFTVVSLGLSELALGEPINIGGIPSGMALSRDQNTLYVTMSNKPSVAVIDIETWTLQPEIRITRPGDQIAVDWQNRLYIGSLDRNEDIMVYDFVKAGVTEPFQYYCAICYRPLLQISNDGRTLYGANRGISAATLAIYDVSGEVPERISDRRDLGSNGQDLHLTKDNKHLYFAVGGGNGVGYNFGKIDVETGDVLGYMETGPYPRQLTTSPDGVYFYAVHTSGHIDVWNTDTLVQITQYPTVGEAKDLITNLTGDYLIAAFDNALRVYEAEGNVIVADEDADGIDDLVDNCIGLYNPLQLNDDSDPLGNECDPFPYESNHEYAQCNVDFETSQLDLLDAIEDLDSCQAGNSSLEQLNTDLFDQVNNLEAQISTLNVRIEELEALVNRDSDGDGVPDLNDLCEGTPLDSVVDMDGCEIISNIRIQAEDYLRYYDTSHGNSGGRYRFDNVDIEMTSDIGGGHNVGWTDNGEWLEYDINLPAGNYVISARVASRLTGSSFRVEVAEQSADANVGNTGGWQSWKTLTLGEFAISGDTTIRVYITGSGVNLNWLQVQLASSEE